MNSGARFRKKKILFIGGSTNQTTQGHAVAQKLKDDFECWFSPFYATGLPGLYARTGALDNTIVGKGSFYQATMKYFRDHDLRVDERGAQGGYDLVVTASDLIVQSNIRGKKFVLIQEGMTDPENWIYRFVMRFGLPRWIPGNTSANGLSNLYTRFCVASEGYKRRFVSKGADESRLIVTGIPNYDHAESYLNNSFPHRDFVLCATTDNRETFKKENRQATIERAVQIAAGRQLIFKFHPNEQWERARSEVERWAPGALSFQAGVNVHEMIANCSTLITQFSTVVYTGIALGKEVYTEFDIHELRELAPWQNGGTSAERIAKVCREVIDS